MQFDDVQGCEKPTPDHLYETPLAKFVPIAYFLLVNFVQQITGGPKFFDGGTKFITLVSEPVGDDSFTHIVEVQVCMYHFLRLITSHWVSSNTVCCMVLCGLSISVVNTNAPQVSLAVIDADQYWDKSFPDAWQLGCNIYSWDHWEWHVRQISLSILIMKTTTVWANQITWLAHMVVSSLRVDVTRILKSDYHAFLLQPVHQHKVWS